MPKTDTSLSLNSFMVSLREFTRNPAIRKKALRQERPVIIEQSRDGGFFVLLPPSLYGVLYELYRDMKDSNDLRAAMTQKTTWHDWNDVRRELDAQC